MNYFEAVSKFKKQEKMIKSFVKCFVEDDKSGRQIQDLSKEFFGVELTDTEAQNMLNGLSREGNLLA